MKKNSRLPPASEKSLRWVVGLHASQEALKIHPQWVREVLVEEGRNLPSINNLAEKSKLSVKNKGKKFFNSLAQDHQGVAVALNNRPRFQEAVIHQKKSLVAFLDGITDPQNLGAILRTAWLLKVDGLFIPKNRRVDLTPTVCKVASGGAEHIPVESCQFQSQLEWFKKKGYWVYGLSEKSKDSFPAQKLNQKTVLIFGSEGTGLRHSTEKFCDQLLTLPQATPETCYNVSVAFALGVYECQRLNFHRF